MAATGEGPERAMSQHAHGADTVLGGNWQAPSYAHGEPA